MKKNLSQQWVPKEVKQGNNQEKGQNSDKNTAKGSKTTSEDYSEGPKVMSAQKLLFEAKKDRNVKVQGRDTPFNNRIGLYDLSIMGRGGKEDEIYAHDAWYRTYIRRGNTLAEIYDVNNKVSSTIYARKGFEKFFDLNYEYILYNLGELKDFSSKFGLHEADEHYQLHEVIFGKAKKAFEEGSDVTVYKLVKANGENAQISWSDKLQGWVIASKNVGIVARDSKDLEEYSEERYHFAKLIAETWFKYVDKIKEDGMLEDLKKELDSRTFVGEYCGNQLYQHLVKYNEIEILFVAAVDNESTVTCIPPEEAQSIFDKYKLPHVKYVKYDQFKDWKSFNNGLKKIFTDVAISDIETEEEGSVLYFVKKDVNGTQETLSLSKLKTMEYRVYRKLREKLRSLIGSSKHTKGGKPNPNSIFNKFVKETNDLCIENPPPNPLGYYFYVGKAAFEYVETYPNDANLIHERYITFLSALLYCVEKDQNLTPQLLKDEKKLQEISTLR